MEKILTSLISLVVSIVLIGCVLSLPTMWLWNALMPDLFGLKEIDFWQSLGVVLLTGILFRDNSND